MLTRIAALTLAATLAACSAARPAPTRDEPGMIGLPGGAYWATQRGSLNESGAYVRVAPFYLDATEVTVASYAACVKTGRCQPAAPHADAGLGTRSRDRLKLDQACNQDKAERADDPINCVAWTDARDYCRFVGKRLPTEDEWEWAARNGDKGTEYPWGDEDPADRACWSGKGNGEAAERTGTCKVGSHPTGDTAAALKDLAGNVAEWTETGTVLKPESTGRGTPGRIARGGAYADTKDFVLQTNVRAGYVESQRSPGLGFRCARDP
jgi:formylglycine-generating enzyme required for sulfatase activity